MWIINKTHKSYTIFKNKCNGKEKTAKGLLWGAMNSTLMQVLNGVIGVVLLWFLDPGDYGMIAVLAIYSAIAANLQDSGFISALINKRDATHQQYRKYMSYQICRLR